LRATGWPDIAQKCQLIKGLAAFFAYRSLRRVAILRFHIKPSMQIRRT